jgi:hypothetical protein
MMIMVHGEMIKCLTWKEERETKPNGDQGKGIA